MSEYERVAKGDTLPDGTYVYTCGHCGGKDAECTWCYGGDTKRLAVEMKTARGERYYGLLKAFLSVNGKAMVDKLNSLRDANGKFTPVEIGYVPYMFGLNFKATWEWLYETRCLRMDYDDVNRKFKASEVYDAVRAKYGVE